LPVIGRKGNEAPRLMVYYASSRQCLTHTLNYVPYTTTTEPPSPRGLLTVLRYSCVCFCLNDRGPFIPLSTPPSVSARYWEGDHNNQQVTMMMMMQGSLIRHSLRNCLPQNTCQAAKTCIIPKYYQFFMYMCNSSNFLRFITE